MTATSSCSNLLVRDASKPSGTIYSTHRNTTYSSNMDCRWNLTSNAVIELSFHYFTTQSSVDYVRVYDGDSIFAPLVGEFSGSFLPTPITSSSAPSYMCGLRLMALRSIEDLPRVTEVFLFVDKMNRKSAVIFISRLPG